MSYLNAKGAKMEKYVCPVWIGYLLANPLRRLIQNPDKMLAPYIQEGMTVMDVGCAMGFFSLPAARMVGETGRVICVDVQARMLAALEKRAAKAGLTDRIESHLCSSQSLDIPHLERAVDFALAMAVVHEVPDAAALLADIYMALKPAGKFLLAEPKAHVTAKDFEKTAAMAQGIGFEVVEESNRRGFRGMLLSKDK